VTILVRHAESAWNRRFGAYRIDAGIPDPGLTPEGVAQARAVAAGLAGRGGDGAPRRVVSSPYRRALQTASIIADALGGAAIEVEPLVRERCAFSCDLGSDPEELAREWPRVDFGALGPVWWGGAIESTASLRARCALYRERLAARADRASLVVVTHWGFIRGLTGLEVSNAALVRLGADLEAAAPDRFEGASPP
jgi:glucosyl-3-phosphoglycerate phosphatase